MNDPSTSTGVNYPALVAALVAVAIVVGTVLRRDSLGPWTIGLLILGVLVAGAALGISMRGGAGRGNS